MIDKIRKLLKLAESPNAHEAAAALNKAHALMAEHNLTHVDAVASEATLQYNPSRCRTSAWERILAQTVAKAFGTQAMIRRHYLPTHRVAHGFIGTPRDVAVSLAAFEGLRKSMLAMHGADGGKNRDYLTAYALGLQDSVQAADRHPCIAAFIEQQNIKDVRGMGLTIEDDEAYQRGRATKLDRNQIVPGEEALAIGQKKSI